MKRSEFTESQILFALKQNETEIKTEKVCRKIGISEATFYNWKKKYSSLGVSDFRRLRQLKKENQKLKQIVADISLDKQMLQDVLKSSAPYQLHEAAMELIGEYTVSVQKATAAVMLHRSVWYYKAKPKNDILLCMRMHEIVHTRIRYGFWRIFILLR